ncbi:phosphotransferase [Rhizobium sp. Root73]|uniref:PHP domain-containing protein n=1 Tax=unclassified Rhizobium TaxID=2613769 RepID=UPI00072AFCF2|nr:MULTISPECIES: CehA/McbA family metallohydrolase [unclassified Rhizobium]KQY00454.1 phosphotransferase [Rhizobium sp. Root1334]KRC11639.1 phosphotransferase [Rhizobium sp. Root73]
MSVNAFSAPGSFFKGNLHTHSTRSDGMISPEEVCRRYSERGYDFICLSDHFTHHYDYPITDTTPYRTNGFTTILGAECHAMGTEGGEHWHVLAVGLPLNFAPNMPDETGPQIAQRCLDAGAFVAIPHPEWYGLTVADAQTIPGAHAVEVYNHTSQVRQARGGGAYYLDDLLKSGRRINALAADDAHWVVKDDENRDAFGGWVMVKAERNEPEALLAALKEGNYYSTQGPTIKNISLDGETVEIECSSAIQIMVVGRGSKNEAISGAEITSAQFPLKKFIGDWCRVMIMAADGKLAWSNPIYL